MASLHNQITCFLCFVIVGLALTTPGCGLFSSKDDTIGHVVDAGNSRRSEMVTPTGKFSDYRVFREVGSDVVVFEHKMKPELQLDKARANSDQFKADLVSSLNDSDSRSVLDAGVTFAYSYIDSSGKTVCRHAITKDDF